MGKTVNVLGYKVASAALAELLGESRLSQLARQAGQEAWLTPALLVSSAAHRDRPGPGHGYLDRDELAAGAVDLERSHGSWLENLGRLRRRHAKSARAVLDPGEAHTARSRLFHQVKPLYGKQLQSEIGGRFQDFPEGWVTRGDFVWTCSGRPYFEWGSRASSMLKFELAPKKGWRFVDRDALEPDPETGRNELVERWRQHAPAQLPPNQFSTELQKQLEGAGFPSHSDFYTTLKIAGFVIDDFQGTPRRSFVFLHPLGGQVRRAKA